MEGQGDLPRVLVVAGRDPTGGAGVDADREALEAHGVRAELVVTADTDQDGVWVRAVRPRDPDEWLAEARTALSELPRPRVVKTGLLPGARHVRALAELAREAEGTFVVDPVLRASGGEVFLDESGVRALLEELLPTGPVLTPNLPEAAELAGLSSDLCDASDAAFEARIEAATRLLARGAAAVLLKGGHGREDPVRNLVLAFGDDPVWTEHPRLVGRSLHGSGCRYASAVAAGLARGASVAEAARAASEYVAGLLAAQRG